MFTRRTVLDEPDDLATGFRDQSGSGGVPSDPFQGGGAAIRIQGCQYMLGYQPLISLAPAGDMADSQGTGMPWIEGNYAPPRSGPRLRCTVRTDG